MLTREESTLSDECAAARKRLSGIVRTTPVRIDASTGIRVKCENFQLTGSFKIRGALNALSALGAAEVVVGSSGNHGIAVAWAARMLGIASTVVMTRASSTFKQETIRRLGARIVLCDGGNNARGEVVREIALTTGAAEVSSYDHPLVVAGQSTVGAEILEQVPDAGTVVVPVGGGGLLAGVALAVAASGRGIRVVGVEPTAADDTRRSLARGERVTIPPPVSLCDGVLAQSPGKFTFPLVQRLVDEVVVAGDDEVVRAMRDVAAQGMTVEPTGALALAGARTLPESEGVVAVVSGGNIRPVDFRRIVDAGPAGQTGTS